MVNDGAVQRGALLAVAGAGEQLVVAAVALVAVLHVVPGIRHGALLADVTLVMSRFKAGDSIAAGRAARRRERLLFGVALEALLSAQVAAVLEHVARLGVQRPERALARLVRRPRHLDEAVVERERVPDRVLPALLVLPVEREQVHDELVDLAQREHLARRVLDGHRDERDVRVRRLGVRVTPPVRLVVAPAGARRRAARRQRALPGAVRNPSTRHAARRAHAAQRGELAVHCGVIAAAGPARRARRRPVDDGRVDGRRHAGERRAHALAHGLVAHPVSVGHGAHAGRHAAGVDGRRLVRAAQAVHAEHVGRGAGRGRRLNGGPHAHARHAHGGGGRADRVRGGHGAHRGRRLVHGERRAHGRRTRARHVVVRRRRVLQLLREHAAGQHVERQLHSNRSIIMTRNSTTYELLGSWANHVATAVQSVPITKAAPHKNA